MFRKWEKTWKYVSLMFFASKFPFEDISLKTNLYFHYGTAG